MTLLFFHLKWWRGWTPSTRIHLTEFAGLHLATPSLHIVRLAKPESFYSWLRLAACWHEGDLKPQKRRISRGRVCGKFSSPLCCVGLTNAAQKHSERMRRAARVWGLSSNIMQTEGTVQVLPSCSSLNKSMSPFLSPCCLFLSPLAALLLVGKYIYRMFLGTVPQLFFNSMWPFISYMIHTFLTPLSH